MCRKAVTERVRSDVLCNPDFFYSGVQRHLEGTNADIFAGIILAGEEIIIGTVLPPVLFQLSKALLRENGTPVFSAFALCNGDLHGVAVNIAHAKPNRFGDAQTGRIHNNRYHTVRWRFETGEQRVKLLPGQHDRQLIL